MTIVLDGSSLTVEKLVSHRAPQRAGRAASRCAWSGSSAAAHCSRRRSPRARSCTASTPASASSPRSRWTTSRSKTSSDISSTTTPPASATRAPSSTCAGPWPAASTFTPAATRAVGPRSPRRWSRCSTRASRRSSARRARWAPAGDLAPMSQIALLLLGEGEAFYEGRAPSWPRRPWSAPASRCPDWRPATGWPTINGSNLLTADERDPDLRHQPLAQAGGDRLRHVARGAAGQPEALRPTASRAARLPRARCARASAILQCIEGSDLLTGKMKIKVQDAYSMRSSPQVIGAAHDALRWAAVAGRDRAQRRRRQPGLPARGEAHPDRRQLPGHARVACRWTWSAPPSPWSACCPSGG